VPRHTDVLVRENATPRAPFEIPASATTGHRSVAACPTRVVAHQSDGRHRVGKWVDGHYSKVDRPL